MSTMSLPSTPAAAIETVLILAALGATVATSWWLIDQLRRRL